MKQALVLLLASIAGVLFVMTRRRKARDSSDLWAEATRALQTPTPTGDAPGTSG